MLGTGPGIFPFFSPFPEVSTWGSRAPSCFDLWGEFFSPSRLKKKFPVGSLLFSSFPLCCFVEAFGERGKKNKRCIFFSFKGARYFSWNGMLETLHHRRLLAWDPLVFTSGWISSNSTEVTGTALAGSSPPRTRGQPYRAKLFSGTSRGPSPVPGRRMGVNGCRAKKTWTSTNFPCKMVIKVLELECWREESGGKASTAKSPTNKSVWYWLR